MNKIFLVVPLFLAGCVSLETHEILGKCGLKGSWSEIELDVSTKEHLLSMSDKDGTVKENLSEVDGRAKDIWFESESGQMIAVCRYNPNERVSTVTPYTIFKKSEGDFEIAEKAFLIRWQH